MEWHAACPPVLVSVLCSVHLATPIGLWLTWCCLVCFIFDGGSGRQEKFKPEKIYDIRCRKGETLFVCTLCVSFLLPTVVCVWMLLLVHQTMLAVSEARLLKAKEMNTAIRLLFWTMDTAMVQGLKIHIGK